LAASFPISIDFQSISKLAACKQTEERRIEICRCLPEHTLIGVDRLDYTKGIPERLKAFQHLLREYPGLHRKITLIQLVVPSREAVPKYQELKREVERLVSRINGEFSEPGWAPIQYLYRSVSLEELLAYYRAADIALVTPLKDGMNLVAKEFCAARIDDGGVLVLSEFAGAAAQLKNGALLVNPYDTRATAETIKRACEMPEEDRRWRMEELRTGIKSHDVFRWLKDFQRAAQVAGSKSCTDALLIPGPLVDEPETSIPGGVLS
jgi:trehalose 6-phosphate synthase